MYRSEYHDGDKKMAELGMMLMNGQDIIELSQFDETDAVSIVHDMTLSKENSRVLKRYLEKHHLGFPNTNELLEARKKLKPVIKPLNEFESNPSNLPGVAVKYEELVKMTTASVFDVVNDRLDHILPQDVTYKMLYKDGADGAGSQAIWKSKSIIGMAPNMYQYSLVPLRLEMVADYENKILWNNPSPNSAYWCPQELIREKRLYFTFHSIHRQVS